MSENTYNPSHREAKYSAALGGLIAAGVLFLCIPLSQLIRVPLEPVLRAIPVGVNQPPPMIEWVEEPPATEQTTEIEVEALEDAIMEISLSEIGNPLAVGIGTGAFVDFDQELEIPADEILSVRDLDRKPRYLSGKPLEYPFEMRRAKIEGYVLLLVMIDEKGSVSVENVLEATNQTFKKSAIAFAESSTFESPRRNGNVVKTRFKLPVKFGIQE
ncbi:MAG: TonB family protein [Opitutales bacterium]